MGEILWGPCVTRPVAYDSWPTHLFPRQLGMIRDGVTGATRGVESDCDSRCACLDMGSECRTMVVVHLGLHQCGVWLCGVHICSAHPCVGQSCFVLSSFRNSLLGKSPVVHPEVKVRDPKNEHTHPGVAHHQKLHLNEIIAIALLLILPPSEAVVLMVHSWWLKLPFSLGQPCVCVTFGLLSSWPLLCSPSHVIMCSPVCDPLFWKGRCRHDCR